MALIELVITNFSHAITSPIFLIVLFISYTYMSKFTQLEESWLGILRNPLNTQFLTALLYGMIVGLLASWAIVIIGIPLDYRAVMYIWPLAILLMLFNRRYMCLSYAGGIISLTSLLFGWPAVHVPSIIALIGILHLMESLLIYFDGSRDSLPVWIEHKKYNAGAYIINKIWPIPLVVLIMPENTAQVASEAIAMPGWWPLFQQQPGIEMLALFPIMAVMGYSDIAITQSSRERVRDSGFRLGAYSLFILALALISTRIYWVSYLAALSTPLLHEMLILYSKKQQLEGEPAFTAPWRGLRILEVLPGHTGESMGLKQKDILLAINGNDINSNEMLMEILAKYPSYVWLDIKRGEKTLLFEHRDYKDGIRELGVIFVPRHTKRHYRIDEHRALIPRIWGNMLNRLKNSR